MEDQKQQAAGVASKGPQRPARLRTKTGPSFETIVAASRRLPLSLRSHLVGSRPTPPSVKYGALRRRVGVQALESSTTKGGDDNAEVSTNPTPKKGSSKHSFRNLHHTIDTGFANVRGTDSNNNSPLTDSGTPTQRESRTEQPSRRPISTTDQRFAALVKSSSPRVAAFASARGSKPRKQVTDPLRSRIDSGDSGSVRSFTVNTEAEGMKNLSETEINRLVRSSIEKARRNAKKSKSSTRSTFEQKVSYKTVLLPSHRSPRSRNKPDDQPDTAGSDDTGSYHRHRKVETGPISPQHSEKIENSSEHVDSSGKPNRRSPRSPNIGSFRQFSPKGTNDPKDDDGKDEAREKNSRDASDEGAAKKGNDVAEDGGKIKQANSRSSSQTSPRAARAFPERVKTSLERAKLARSEIAELLQDEQVEASMSACGSAADDKDIGLLVESSLSQALEDGNCRSPSRRFDGGSPSNTNVSGLSKSRVDHIVAETMRRAKEAAKKDKADSSSVSSPESQNKDEWNASKETISRNSVKNETNWTPQSDAGRKLESISDPSPPKSPKKSASARLPKSPKNLTPDRSPTTPKKSPTNQSHPQETISPKSQQDALNPNPPELLESSPPVTCEGSSTVELKPIGGNMSALSGESTQAGAPEATNESVSNPCSPTPANDPAVEENASTSVAISERSLSPKSSTIENKSSPKFPFSEALTYRDLLISMSNELKESLAAASGRSNEESVSTTEAGSKQYDVDEDDANKTRILQSTLTQGDVPDNGLEVALVSKSETSSIEECGGSGARKADSGVPDPEKTDSDRNLSPQIDCEDSSRADRKNHDSPVKQFKVGQANQQTNCSEPVREENGAVEGRDERASDEESHLYTDSTTPRGKKYEDTETTDATTPVSKRSGKNKSPKMDINTSSRIREQLKVDTSVSTDDEFVGTTILSRATPSDASQLTGRSGKYSRSIRSQRLSSGKHGKHKLARSPSNETQDTVTVTEEFLAQIASRKGATLTTDELNRLLRAATTPKKPSAQIETIESSGSDESASKSSEAEKSSAWRRSDIVNKAVLSQSHSSGGESQSSHESDFSTKDHVDRPFCVDFIDMLRQIGFRDVTEDSLIMHDNSLVSGSFSDDSVSDDDSINEMNCESDKTVEETSAVRDTSFDKGGGAGTGNDSNDEEPTKADEKSTNLGSDSETYKQESTNIGSDGDTFGQETAGSASYETGGQTFDKEEASDGETLESLTQEERQRVTFSFSEGRFSLDEFASSSSLEEETTESTAKIW